MQVATCQTTLKHNSQKKKKKTTTAFTATTITLLEQVTRPHFFLNAKVEILVHVIL